MFRLKPSMTIGGAKKAFADAFGGVIRVKGDDNATLASIGLSSDITADSATTVAAFCESAKNAGLTLKVRTADDWVAVIDEFPIGSISQIGKNSNKAKMYDILSSLASAPTPKAAAAEPKAPAEPKSAPAPAAKPAKTSDPGLITKEEMEELLKQIAQLRDTIGKLESRIAKLEKAPVSKAGNANVRTVEKAIARCGREEKDALDGRKKIIQHYFLTNKNRVLRGSTTFISSSDKEYDKKLEIALIEAGEDMRPSPGESKDIFATKLRAKYGISAEAPLILGGILLGVSYLRQYYVCSYPKDSFRWVKYE